VEGVAVSGAAELPVLSGVLLEASVDGAALVAAELGGLVAAEPESSSEPHALNARHQ
jgi:hypothetical protein